VPCWDDLVTDTAALDARIAEATGRLRERDRLASRLTELDRALAEREAAVSALVATADQENRDVARLEGLTLDRVLAALRGSRDDDLARERAEADAAAYRLADERARRDLVLRERDGIQARHRSLSAAEGRARGCAGRQGGAPAVGPGRHAVGRADRPGHPAGRAA
jgi:hypothetical protein